MNAVTPLESAPTATRPRVHIVYFPGLNCRRQWEGRTGTVTDQAETDAEATGLVSVQLDGDEDAPVIAVPVSAVKFIR
jgi:hypothetical protein